MNYKEKVGVFFTQPGAEEINGFKVTATFLTSREISDILQRTVFNEREKLKLLCCSVLKKFSISMMKNGIDRERLSPFQQNRETITAKLPQAKN